VRGQACVCVRVFVIVLREGGEGVTIRYDKKKKKKKKKNILQFEGGQAWGRGRVRWACVVRACVYCCCVRGGVGGGGLSLLEMKKKKKKKKKQEKKTDIPHSRAVRWGVGGAKGTAMA